MFNLLKDDDVFISADRKHTHSAQCKLIKSTEQNVLQKKTSLCLKHV